LPNDAVQYPLALMCCRMRALMFCVFVFISCLRLGTAN
jgi:hypothetical protein